MSVDLLIGWLARFSMTRQAVEGETVHILYYVDHSYFIIKLLFSILSWIYSPGWVLKYLLWFAAFEVVCLIVGDTGISLKLTYTCSKITAYTNEFLLSINPSLILLLFAKKKKMDGDITQYVLKCFHHQPQQKDPQNKQQTFVLK